MARETKFKPNEIDYEMADGTTVKLSLSMMQLYLLKSRDKKAYESLSGLLTRGPSEVLELGEMLYGAYLCANLSGENNYTLLEFLERMNPSLEINSACIEALIKSKKK